jgi:hypothetical protein
MKPRYRKAAKPLAAILLAGTLFAVAQTTSEPQSADQPQKADQPQNPAPPPVSYQPKFPGDPARSEAEASALGYMRTVLRAQNQYKKKNGKYAASLAALVHTGSFTRRMTNTDRGDYTVSFRSRKDGFELALTPKLLDATHRSFYADDDGTIHVEEEKAADSSSPPVKWFRNQ